MNSKDTCLECIKSLNVEIEPDRVMAALRMGDSGNEDWCSVCKSLFLVPLSTKSDLYSDSYVPIGKAPALFTKN